MENRCDAGNLLTLKKCSVARPLVGVRSVETLLPMGNGYEAF